MKLGINISAPVEQISDLRFTKNIFVQEGGTQLKNRVNGITSCRIVHGLGYSELEVLYRKNSATVLSCAQTSCQPFFGRKNHPTFFSVCPFLLLTNTF